MLTEAMFAGKVFFSNNRIQVGQDIGSVSVLIHYLTDSTIDKVPKVPNSVVTCLHSFFNR